MRPGASGERLVSAGVGAERAAVLNGTEVMHISTGFEASSASVVAPADVKHGVQASAVPTPASRLLYALLVALVFVLALLPRLGALGEATTEDEDQWIRRSGNFAEALLQQRWRQTYQIGHPGVTTMWVTVLGLGPERARHFSSTESEGAMVTRQPGFLEALRAARVPFAILGALLAATCCALAWRLFGAGPGLLSGVLLALDPYWMAMSPVVGMDSLLAGLVGASLLCSLLAFWRPPRRPELGLLVREPVLRVSVRQGAPWALVSGLLAGLGLLTKGPALFLLPMMPLISLVVIQKGLSRGRKVLGPIVAIAAVWAVGIALAGAIWPAFLASPVDTLRRMMAFVQEIGTTPHAPGNFFLGQPVVDPGPLFYPVAAILRMGPGILVGLLALAYFGAPGRTRPASAILLAFVALYVLGLTMSPKKVDRYVLAIFPALGILAGLGWSIILGRLAPRFRAAPVAGLLVAGLVQIWPLLGAWPHPLAAFNPLVGGMATAVRTLPVGWGEGLDSVGEYLQQEPAPDDLVTGIWYPLYVNFQAHAPGQVSNISFSSPGRVGSSEKYQLADFYVDYVHARQRGLTPDELRARRPDYVVTIGGVEYARVYRLK